MRRMRAMLGQLPGRARADRRDLRAEHGELDSWYGGARHDELQLPMDTLSGSATSSTRRVPPTSSRRPAQLQGSQPLLVFDNHDHVRSWDRYGDGMHDAEIAKILGDTAADLARRRTAVSGRGDRAGHGHPDARGGRARSIGITGWPKEKGRDGERTPMQWDADPQAGSAPAHTVAAGRRGLRAVNVRSETADAGRC